MWSFSNFILHCGILLDLIDMAASAAIVIAIAIASPLSVWCFLDDIVFPCGARGHLPLPQYSPDWRFPHPFNLLKGDALGYRNIRMFPSLSIDFNDCPCHDAVIGIATEYGGVVGSLDAEMHITVASDEGEDGPSFCVSSESRLHACCEVSPLRYQPWGYPDTLPNRTGQRGQASRTADAR